MKYPLYALAVVLLAGAGYGLYQGLAVHEPTLPASELTEALPEGDATDILAQAEKVVHPALQIQPRDIIKGDPNAPVTLIEYVSMTCPHCAKFHLDILPEVQSYIDNGQLNVIMRDLPWDNFAWA